MTKFAKRPYSDPANVQENGQPVMSEDAWDLYESHRLHEYEVYSRLAQLEQQLGGREIVYEVSGLHRFTTVGGSATETFTCDECRAGCFAMAQVSTPGATPVYVKSSIAGNGTCSVTFSANPQGDTVVSVFILN